MTADRYQTDVLELLLSSAFSSSLIKPPFSGD